MCQIEFKNQTPRRTAKEERKEGRENEREKEREKEREREYPLQKAQLVGTQSRGLNTD